MIMRKEEHKVITEMKYKTREGKRIEYDKEREDTRTPRQKDAI